MNAFRIRFLQSLLVLVWLGFATSAQSGEYRVSPIRLFLDQGVRTGVITVTNESTGPIQLQVRSFEWSQDAEGKDQYIETQDIIFFPKFLEMEMGDKRVLRVGIKQPKNVDEKTYRLFIEEIRKPPKNREGTGVDIAIRFGVPIFVAPDKKKHNGTIDGVMIEKEKLSVNISNTGNSHLMIDAIIIKGMNADGHETFSHELSGWYLLAGVMRTYAIPISQEECSETAKVNVEVQSKQLTFNEQVDAISSLCMP